MKIYTLEKKKYHLPSKLNNFQLKMYTHLINWKWSNLTLEPGFFKGIPFDAILPDGQREKLSTLYPPIKERFLDHQKKYPFKSHKFLAHMASSQAACANLFLPLLENPYIASEVLSIVKPDLKEIATDYLDNGFRIEFWDEPDNLLNDHTKVSGTDADIAIAYYDKEDNLCLWLIEHKLTEKEFTTCRGAKSKGFNFLIHSCKPSSAIVKNPNLCYYHSACKFNYWDITLSDISPFNKEKIEDFTQCPFIGGMNQLWRNQLLATGLEASNSPRWPFSKAYFSVAYHPGNYFIEPSIKKFKKLIDPSDRFFAFTSDKLINRAKEIDGPKLYKWLKWYQELYYL